MPNKFKLIFKLVKEKFSKTDQEWQWTYQCLFEFNFKKRVIKKITITDHLWKKKGREWITKELVLNIFEKELNGRQKMRPVKRINGRDIYIREWVPYDERDYRLIFWFKDRTTNHLWIRNCYPID